MTSGAFALQVSLEEVLGTRSDGWFYEVKGCGWEGLLAKIRMSLKDVIGYFG